MVKLTLFMFYCFEGSQNVNRFIYIVKISYLKNMFIVEKIYRNFGLS